VIASRGSEGAAGANVAAVTDRQAKPELRTTNSEGGCYLHRLVRCSSLLFKSDERQKPIIKAW